MRVACLWFSRAAPTAQIAEIMLRFSPQICLRGEQAVFVEIGKCQNLYTEHGFMMRAKKVLSRLGHAPVIRIGSTLTEALALAKFDAARIEELPLAALLEFADPFVKDMALRKSVLKLIDSFQNLGVHTIGQFRQIPLSDLIVRFGMVGRFCHQRALLQDFVAWPSWAPEEIVCEKTDFSYFEYFGDLEPILFVLKGQLDAIFARLFARKQRALRLQVQIRCEKLSVEPEPLRTFDFEFFSPQGSTKGALKIFQERLTREFARKPILSQIEGVETKVLRAIHFESGQKNIFNNDEEKLEQIHSIHNQLIELLGKENVFQAELVPDRRPERAWIKRFDRPHETTPTDQDLGNIIPERSTYLCQRPVKIEVTAGFVHIRKKRYRILHWDNQVEKISGGWFEKPTIENKDSYDRNYYHVEIEGRQRITIFETPDREFFLHGYYG